MASAGPVNAQLRLSLAEALRLGLTYNPTLQTAMEREDNARINQQYGNPERLPSVDLLVSQNNYFNQYDSPTNFIRGIYRDHSFNGGVSGSWLLFNGGRVHLGQTRLAQQSQQATLETQSARQLVSQAITSAYFGVVFETAKLAIRAEGAGFSKANWLDFKEQERLGKASLFDVLQAENLFLIDSTTYLQQEIAVQVAQNKLHTVLGWNRFELMILTDSLTPEPQPPAFSNLAGKLMSLNFDLRSRRLGILLADNNIRLQKTVLAPVIRLNSALYQSFTQTKFSEARRIDGQATNLMLTGLSVSLPLIRSGEVRRNIRQSELERKLAETITKGQERYYLAEADLLGRSYQTQAKIVALSAALVSNAARSLTIANKRLQTGFSNLLEYRSIQLAYTEAKLNRLMALYQLKLIEAGAKQLTGTLN